MHDERDGGFAVDSAVGDGPRGAVVGLVFDAILVVEDDDGVGVSPAGAEDVGEQSGDFRTTGDVSRVAVWGVEKDQAVGRGGAGRRERSGPGVGAHEAAGGPSFEVVEVLAEHCDGSTSGLEEVARGCSAGDGFESHASAAREHVSHGEGGYCPGQLVA